MNKCKIQVLSALNPFIHAQCENVEMIPPNHIKFDFLGKDSIKYENTVEVHKKVS